MTTITSKDAAYAFAENIVASDYDRLPAPAVEAAKKSILDTLAVMAGATGTTAALKGVVDIAKEMEGAPEATLIGFRGKVPALMAAFVNGAMTHCLDYDDVEYTSGYHPSSAVVPAGFSVAQRIGSASGRKSRLCGHWQSAHP